MGTSGIYRRVIARSPASHLRETSHHVSCTWCIYCWLFAHGTTGMHAAKGSQHLVCQTPIACGTHGGCESGEELNCDKATRHSARCLWPSTIYPGSSLQPLLVVRYTKKLDFIGIMPSISQRRFMEQAFGVPTYWSSWTMINVAAKCLSGHSARAALVAN